MTDVFLNRANTLRTEYLMKTEALFAANRNDWFADFDVHFRQICAQIKRWQAKAELPRIVYLEYTMLYSNFISRRYVAEVFVYNDRSYLDKNQHLVGEYDISLFFTSFDELWDKLLSERKRYVGKVVTKDITAFMLEVLPDFYSYLVTIARFAIANCIDKSPFTDIDKSDEFMINVGNYMSKTENVYTEKKNKDAVALAEWFDEQNINEYTFDDYSKLDLSGCSFIYTGFRYSQFRYSFLNNVSLKGCALIGTSFHGACMENCCIDLCSIYEADFSHAILINASFVNARGRAGLPNEREWRQVGFLPVNFRYADLTGVSFTGASLGGADFTGANLTGADFTGAILDGADFTDAVLDGAIFDAFS